MNNIDLEIIGLKRKFREDWAEWTELVLFAICPIFIGMLLLFTVASIRRPARHEFAAGNAEGVCYMVSDSLSAGCYLSLAGGGALYWALLMGEQIQAIDYLETLCIISRVVIPKYNSFVNEYRVWLFTKNGRSPLSW